MKVYALYDVCYDGGCQTYENIVDLYMNYDDALMEQIKLEEVNKDPNQSYDVREMAVK